MRAVVVLADGFEEMEAVAPIDLLRRAGVTVVVAGLDGLSARSSRGLVVGCDARLSEVPLDWDAFVLPGGMPGAKTLAESPLVKLCLQDSVSRGAWVAALCASPVVVLGALGFLKGRRFTGYPGTEGETGGHYSDDAVVVDDQLLTSRGVGTASAFALKLVEVLVSPEKAAEVARATLLA